MAYCKYCDTYPFATECASYHQHVATCRRAYERGTTAIVIQHPNEISLRLERELWDLPYERLNSLDKINRLLDNIIECVPDLAAAYDNKIHPRHTEAKKYIHRIMHIMKFIVSKNEELVESIVAAQKELAIN
nr:hypothetical protein K-LCC10_0341 [Kaumoebavirus]